MNSNFIVFETNAHSQVFLLRAVSEEQAWNLYLEAKWDYQEQENGTYCRKTIIHDSLQDAFDAYGITRNPDEFYLDGEGFIFASLQDVKSTYNIEEKSDGTVDSKGKCYLNLAEAINHIARENHRIELTRCDIREDEAIQLLFTSKDEWEYIEQATLEYLQANIVNQHRWQSRRYEHIGHLSEAIAELKKAQGLAVLPKDKLTLHLDIARLLVESTQPYG